MYSRTRLSWQGLPIREQNKVTDFQSQIIATDFIKNEEIKIYELHLKMGRQRRISDITALQEKIVELKILLRQNK
jgi:hypothetical protein